MSPDRPFKILFLCTGNSARSIFCEYLIRRLGKQRFESFSAGADPRPFVNPYAIRVLQESYEMDASAFALGASLHGHRHAHRETATPPRCVLEQLGVR